MSINTTTVARLQNELRSSKDELAAVTEQMKQLTERKKELTKRVADIKKELQLVNDSESSMSQYDREDFPWSKDVVDKLRKVFKIQGFRSHQKAAVNATLGGADLILVMPTGGGKSLCFQLPAVISSGVTLVVSPLISLMEDQLQGLQELGVCTEIFNAQTDKETTKRIFANMVDPKSTLKLLYVTPEKLAKSKRLMAQVEKMYRMGRFARLVIDEVHCCSQWGHDFRPDYKFLGIMKNQYPKTPIIGLTATATANVIVDIQKILNIEGCLVLRDSFYRPNLRYSVVDAPVKDKIGEIASMIKRQFDKESGIIYCLTVKDCEDVAKQLKLYGIRSACYHSQLDPERRTLVQQRWCQNDIQVIVATVAFGMGINKLDVRFVIHYSMSKSVENYYQETGRAGRDGLHAECILFYSFQDMFRASCIMMTERNGIQNVYNMARYAQNQTVCRKQQIAVHFGDSCTAIKDGCFKCDNCDFHKEPERRTEIKINGKKLIQHIITLIHNAASLDERLTALKLMDAWFNKGPSKLRVADVPVPKYAREICEKLVAQLVVQGFLKEDFHFTPYSTISYLTFGLKSYDLSEVATQDMVFTFYTENHGTKSISNGKNKTTKSNDSDEDFRAHSPKIRSSPKLETPARQKRKLSTEDELQQSSKKIASVETSHNESFKSIYAQTNTRKKAPPGVITID